LQWLAPLSELPNEASHACVELDRLPRDQEFRSFVENNAHFHAWSSFSIVSG